MSSPCLLPQIQHLNRLRYKRRKLAYELTCINLQLTFDASITLLAHIIPAEVASAVSVPMNYVTLAGHTVEITPGNNYTIMDSMVSAGIVASDFVAYNGLINILDDVSVIPQSARPFNASKVR